MAETMTIEGEARVATTTVLHPGGGVTLIQTARVDLGTSPDIGIRVVGAWHLTAAQMMALIAARKGAPRA